MHTIRQVTEEIRPRIKELFQDHKPVDLSLDSIVMSGQSGGRIQLLVDDPLEPKAVQLTQGSFTVFAGDVESREAEELVRGLAPMCYVMPCSERWMALLYSIHGSKLETALRYSFSSKSLNREHVGRIVSEHPDAAFVERIDKVTADGMIGDDWHQYHFMNYDSAQQFVDTGFGFCVRKDSRVVAACSSGLVSGNGAEICIITLPEYRRMGVATLVAAKFILYCLEQGLEPHWDAANLSSVGLAKKLGYTYKERYAVHFRP